MTTLKCVFRQNFTKTTIRCVCKQKFKLKAHFLIKVAANGSFELIVDNFISTSPLKTSRSTSDNLN